MTEAEEIEAVANDLMYAFKRGEIKSAWEAEATARVAIAALRALGWQRVPEGYAVVPREPTEEIVNAGCDCTDVGSHTVVYSGLYRAMIQAGEVKP